MGDLMDCEDVPMHVELRHGGRRLPLEFRYSMEEHAYVAFLPDCVAAFTASNGRAVDLIAYLLRLDVRDDPEPTP